MAHAVARGTACIPTRSGGQRHLPAPQAFAAEAKDRVVRAVHLLMARTQRRSIGRQIALGWLGAMLGGCTGGRDALAAVPLMVSFARRHCNAIHHRLVFVASLGVSRLFNGPTCRTVRERLGGSSMTKISRMMHEIERASITAPAAPVSLTPASLMPASLMPASLMPASLMPASLMPAQTACVNQTMEALLGELRQENRSEIDRIKRASEERDAAAERRAGELAEVVDAE